ncbi:aldo/keto reductase [Terriglobus aquaticus]|uniref:Aldo/keto reductase n=1 Tax=Terriglobus aquaticus TaxID=940139 RepID=A0ABW9KP19_9BACT|nr:aldo/keto reductase [Terriglobus aquaticus]
MKPNDLRTLGRSGLLVSPVALGTMTFGTPRWGSPDDVSEQVFRAYIDAGGNFLDTADVYAKGRSEELLGGYIAEAGLRDDVVLATKYTFNPNPGRPLLGGNSRKNLIRALEGSLRRLRTDYVDLLWMHAWDQVTPIDEVLQSMGDLIRAGKIRYFGLSDVPAWYATRIATLAEARGVPGPIALQMEYSLTSREIEAEYVKAAEVCGMGITPWSPLAAGFLAGKYSRNASGSAQQGGGRLDLNLPSFQKFTERNWQVLERVRQVAAEAGLDLAQMALAWVYSRPGVTSTILGAKTVEQLRSNLAALDLQLSREQVEALDRASATEPTSMDRFFSPAGKKMIFAGAEVHRAF